MINEDRFCYTTWLYLNVAIKHNHNRVFLLLLQTVTANRLEIWLEHFNVGKVRSQC